MSWAASPIIYNFRFQTAKWWRKQKEAAEVSRRWPRWAEKRQCRWDPHFRDLFSILFNSHNRRYKLCIHYSRRWFYVLDKLELYITCCFQIAAKYWAPFSQEKQAPFNPAIVLEIYQMELFGSGFSVKNIMMLEFRWVSSHRCKCNYKITACTTQSG